MPKLHIPRAQRDNYETPADVFDQLDRSIGPFDMDPACEPHQYSAMKILARGGEICVPPGCTIPEDYGPKARARILPDGLKMAWHGKTWLNPPYGDALTTWVPYAVNEVACGNAELVCALLPVYTGPKWWQENVLRDVRWVPGHAIGPEWVTSGWEVTTNHMVDRVIFLPGRISFVGADNTANFNSCVVVWKKRTRESAV